MLRIHTAIEIAAPPERIWHEITSLDQWAQWNPIMTRASGVVAVGRRVKVYIAPVTYKVRVTEVVPNRVFRWVGKRLIQGFMDGGHAFLITPLEGGRVRLEHTEQFTGMLVPLLNLVGLGRITRNGFEKMNAALKRRCEGP
ncbi:MAG: SRPBCC domain-containing protein [Chloroflexi bacterium]|nr:SRPBCC domain-containing protein [Chloroflexota bacterium]